MKKGRRKSRFLKRRKRTKTPHKDKFSMERELKAAPWLTKKTSRIKTPQFKLHNEIIEFCQMIEPKKEKLLLRKKAFEKISKLIADNVADVSVHPFGSYLTKLFLPNADIDIVVLSSTLNEYGLLSRIGNLILHRKEEYINC